MTDKELLQGIELLEGAIPFDEVRNGDGWLDVHELFTEISQLIDLWHYPSMGEYPTDDRRVLCIVDGEPYIAEYHSASGNWYSDKMSCSSAFVECWKEILPPKEEE